MNKTEVLNLEAVEGWSILGRYSVLTGILSTTFRRTIVLLYLGTFSNAWPWRWRH